MRPYLVLMPILLVSCARPDGEASPSPSDLQPQTAAAAFRHAAPKASRPRTAQMASGQPRSERDIQIARNVTAILRGMRRVELERTAEGPPCGYDCD